MMVREEYNLPLTKDAYEHLIVKADGTVISKTRYRMSYNKNHRLFARARPGQYTDIPVLCVCVDTIQDCQEA